MTDIIHITKTPVKSEYKTAVDTRNVVLRSDKKHFLMECLYCGQAHTMDRKKLWRCFPLKKGYPAIKCNKCGRNNFLSLICNTPASVQTQLELK